MEGSLLWDLHHHSQVKLLGITLERKCSRALPKKLEIALSRNSFTWKHSFLQVTEANMNYSIEKKKKGMHYFM